MTINVDEEVYPLPSDDRTDEEIKDYLVDLIHEIDGFEMRHIRIVIGDRRNE
jgi:ATP-dependent 26S proteasome regulatory subunit|tara:strand:- start:976 stop:1131 length:156 start_codon:yes stop_codon:yes gene_type:complete